ncbi:hypothetical protein BCR36DRAFT_374967 [Piromyces finnis]|uniref:Uncharacterized protein n=1 Tax=Piromyces finnis TaxID=1754191 RepID=A0A1Y1UV39_9FUNG|nr:hypothetical protein BCR36DRAFT_374967 [Piromyces finnis]|eukprot:ORX41839.1 hypothetical protein BCR36DRAFT_374967 [Piromyces finnis]
MFCGIICFILILMYYIFIYMILFRSKIFNCFSSEDDKNEDNTINNSQIENQMVQRVHEEDDDDILPPYSEIPRISTIVYQTSTPLNSPDIVIDITSIPPPYEEIVKQNNTHL